MGVRQKRLVVRISPEVVEHWARDTRKSQQRRDSSNKFYFDRDVDPARECDIFFDSQQPNLTLHSPILRRTHDKYESCGCVCQTGQQIVRVSVDLIEIYSQFFPVSVATLGLWRADHHRASQRQWRPQPSRRLRFLQHSHASRVLTRNCRIFENERPRPALQRPKCPGIDRNAVI
jgi:hypothetical protein